MLLITNKRVLMFLCLKQIKILWVVIGITAVSISGSFKSDMDLLAMNMAKSLKFTPQKVVCITVIPDDKSYMLPMMPVYKELQKHLESFAKEVRFNSFRGRESTIIKEMVLSGSLEYKPFGFHEKSVDSLILYGTCYLVEDNPEQINFDITVIDIRANRLFQSSEITLNKVDCPKTIARGIFNTFRDKQVFQEIAFKGKIIAELDKLFNCANNNLLAYPAKYRFEKKNPYAIQWQVDMLKETLSLKYGITFNNECDNTIIVQPTGVVVFARNNIERQIDRVIDGEPLLPVQFLEEYDSLYYLYSAMNTPVQKAVFETKPWETSGEKSIRDQIYKIFNTYYPKLFSTFNYSLLNDIYVDTKHPSILVGTKLVSDPGSGRELINYSWHSKQGWLAGLRKAHQERNRSFDVDTYVMGIFNDNLDPHRYWAIVAQKWQTKDMYGNCVYSDDGFLIVNFDFDADRQLKEFAIYYRLWFYNYQYDNIETGVTRYDKLQYDINSHFVNGLNGIDSTLKEGMRDFLIRKIRVISSHIKEKKGSS